MSRRFVASWLVRVLVGVFAISQAVAAQEKITLTLANIWGGTRIPLMERVIEEFEAKYPWIEVQNFVGGQDMLDAQLIAIAAGSPPDVLMVDRLRLLEYVSQDLLLPLDPFIAQSGLDLGIFFPGERALSQLNGVTYVLPMPTASLSLLYYNRDIFSRRGLDPDAPPQTFNDFSRTALLLQEIDGNGDVRVGGGSIAYFPRHRMAQLGALNGARVLGGSELVPNYLDSRMREAAEWAAEFAASVVPGGSLALGEKAMETHGEWRYFEMKQESPTTDIGIALVPHGPDGEYVNLAAAAWSFGIPRGVAHPYESYLLIEHLTASESAQFFAFEQGRPSPVIEFSRDPRYYELNPFWDVVIQSLERSIGAPPSTVAQKVIDADIKWYGAMLSGAESPLNALTHLQNEVEAILANEGLS